jgi:choline kinase
MAAGLGKRLAPITDHWPKPVLPIDGLPVVVTLVHELAAAGIERFVVVTGHLARQVEAILAPLPYELRFVRQPAALGSADAVARAGAAPPYVVAGADTRFAPGDIARFVASASGSDGAVAVRRQPGRPEHTSTLVEDGRVLRVSVPGSHDGGPARRSGSSARGSRRSCGRCQASRRTSLRTSSRSRSTPARWCLLSRWGAPAT